VSLDNFDWNDLECDYWEGCQTPDRDPVALNGEIEYSRLYAGDDVDGLCPIRSQGGHEPSTCVTANYEQHGIFFTDDYDPNETRTSGIIGAKQQRDLERRELTKLLDPGYNKVYEKKRKRREGLAGTRDRKLAERINRERQDWQLPTLSGAELLAEVQRRRQQIEAMNLKADFREFLEQAFARSKSQINRILEAYHDGATGEAYVQFQSARAAGWVSTREQRDADRACEYSSADGDGERRFETPATPAARREEIERLTEEFLAGGGAIEQCPPAEESWSPEFAKKMKYRWLRYDRW
jgi:hypothetical protein